MVPPEPAVCADEGDVGRPNVAHTQIHRARSRRPGRRGDRRAPRSRRRTAGSRRASPRPPRRGGAFVSGMNHRRPVIGVHRMIRNRGRSDDACAWLRPATRVRRPGRRGPAAVVRRRRVAPAAPRNRRELVLPGGRRHPARAHVRRSGRLRDPARRDRRVATALSGVPRPGAVGRGRLDTRCATRGRRDRQRDGRVDRADRAPDRRDADRTRGGRARRDQPDPASRRTVR